MLRTFSSIPMSESSPNKQPVINLKDELAEQSQQQSILLEEENNDEFLKNLEKNVKNSREKRKKNENESSDDEDEEKMNNQERNYFNDEEEVNLENLVFGSEKFMLENIEKKKNNKLSTGLKFNDLVSSEDVEKKSEVAECFQERKPAWQDNNEEEQKNKSEAKKFIKYYGTPLWADLDIKKKQKNAKKKSKSLEEDESDDEDENVNDFQRTGNFLEDKDTTGSLPKTTLDIKICTDANKEEPHKSRLKVVEFHPCARVMLTAGLDQKLTLFQIDGKKNSKIQTIFIEKFPILAAHFTRGSGDQIILGSRHKNFYYFDMNSGKVIGVNPPIKALEEFQRPSMSTNFEISPDNRFIAFVGSQGQIHLFSVKSKEWINSLKINDSCNAIAFSSDSRYLFAFGDDKDVNVFDMNDRGNRTLHKFTDYGCLSGTSIAVSNNSQYIATGCKSGVVNIYNLSDSLLINNKNPKPIKSFMNLTTPCTSLKFNNTSEILAACSAFTDNACKLIHVGSMSVFANFPLRNNDSNIRMPECIDFSLNSGYLTIGNNKGNALLYRLKHYGSF